ncbi:MAG: sulfatase [Planctomycetota bacterium]
MSENPCAFCDLRGERLFSPMRLTIYFLTLLILIFHSGSAPAGPPNVVLILMDDMGWRDVGFAGNDFVETPNLDRLASEGIRFTQAYASAPNCAPTRACLMSGQYTPRHGVFTVIDPRHDPGQSHHKVISAKSNEALSGDVITIAELLQSKGYATACFGMWNLGRGRSGPATPTGQGFDLFTEPKSIGFEKDAYFDSEGRYCSDVLTDETLSFIESHRSSPFFIYLATHDVHAPLEPKPELIAKYQKKSQRVKVSEAEIQQAAAVEAIDTNVGRIMNRLRELKIDDNTIVIFTSDNGGTPQFVAPLNGSKGALYEGGIRVPAAIWWKDLKNPGRTFDEPVLSMDFYPTIAELTGIDLPRDQPVDGTSLASILRDETKSLQREAVFWHFPCYIGRGEPSSAVRMGDWKLIEKFQDETFELYNLRNDPGEKTNLAPSESEHLQRLKKTLRLWQDKLHAPRPTDPNPNYDPSAVQQRGPRNGGGGGDAGRGKGGGGGKKKAK